MHISIRLIVLLLFVSPSVTSITAQSTNKYNRGTDDPTIIIHDTVIAPGELLLQIDAFNFVGDNGQISAISLRIDIDTMLLQFINIQNTTLSGIWFANYNTFTNDIAINYNAPFNQGYDINGKLLDLKLTYTGGFDADLKLKSTCEISNINLVSLTGIIYDDGYIEQIETDEEIYQDSIIGFLNQPFLMPIIAEGTHYDSVNQIYFRLGYDTTLIEYTGVTEKALQGVVINSDNDIIDINWQNNTPVDFTAMDTMMLLQFNLIEDTNVVTELLPGSKVYNNGTIIASEFSDGYVRAKLEVVLLNQPDTAGTTIGGGYYFIGDSVTVTAIPEVGFHFTHWTQNDITVSSDSIYTFVKLASTDTLIANYEVNSYDVDILIIPINGGSAIGEGTYNYGEYVTILATPEFGYEFTAWLVDGQIVSYNPVYSFYMPPNNTTLTASFGLSIYTVSVEPNNPNYGTTEGGGEYSHGDTATIVATPFTDYIFVAWTEGGQTLSTDLTYSFIVTSDHSIIGNFQYISNCSAPIGLFAGNISETSSNLSWISSGDEQEWDLLWGETGFDTITGGNLVEGLFDTEYILEDLNQGTEYDFYVMAVCNDSTNSSWSDPYTFTTLYVGIKNTVSEGFSVYPIPASNSLFIKSRKAESAKYWVINIMGAHVDSGVIDGNDIHVLNVEAYHPGLYFIKLFNSSFNGTVTFLKK